MGTNIQNHSCRCSATVKGSAERRIKVNISSFPMKRTVMIFVFAILMMNTLNVESLSPENRDTCPENESILTKLFIEAKNVTEKLRSVLSLALPSSWNHVREFSESEYECCSFSISSDGRTLVSGEKGSVHIATSSVDLIDLSLFSDGDGDENTFALSGDGSTLVVGDTSYGRDNVNDTFRIGQALVFSKTDSSSWDQLDERLVGASRFEGLGCSVDTSDDGNRIAVGGGESSEDDVGNFKNFVQVFENIDGVWDDIFKNTPANVEIGSSLVSNYESTVLLSGDGSTLIFGFDKVYVFDLDDNLEEAIDIQYSEDYPNPRDPQFSISNDGSTYAVSHGGACSGYAVDVFTKTGSGYGLVGGTTSDNHSISPWVKCESISLSSDGSLLACGKPYHGISGKVSIYSIEGNNIRSLRGIDGYAYSVNKFGIDVSFIGNGNQIAVASEEKVIILEQ